MGLSALASPQPIGRGRFFLALFFLALASFAFLDGAFLALGPDSPLLAAGALAACLLLLALIRARLADAGFSARWLFLFLIPVVGWIILFFLLLRRSVPKAQDILDALDAQERSEKQAIRAERRREEENQS